MLRFVSLVLCFIMTFFIHGDATAKPVQKHVHKKHVHKKHAPKQKGAPKHAKHTEEEVDSDPVTRFPGTTDVQILAKQVIVMEFESGRVLLEKNADVKMAPSSMTKMMTSFIIEDYLGKGKIQSDSTFVVSEKAWKTEGSRTFLQVGTTVSLMDLLKGIIIQSGNDASVAAAEGISGTEEHFALLMNEMARDIGMINTHFVNASGLPHEDHYSTARDLAKLGIAMIRQHPEFYHLYSEKDFTYNKITQGNRNPLLYKEVGCDGIKTGHTEDGGYGMVASFTDGGQRYIIVINGLKTMQKRANEALKLLSWTKQNFLAKIVFKKGDIVEENAPVWLGEKKSIPLKAVEEVSLLVPRSEQVKLDVKVQYESPLQAPLTKDQIVGKIIVTSPSTSYEVSLVASEDCPRAGFFERMWRSFYYLVMGND